jgi:hypothetical protein
MTLRGNYYRRPVSDAAWIVAGAVAIGAARVGVFVLATYVLDLL